jgi:hypothetical protein
MLRLSNSCSGCMGFVLADPGEDEIAVLIATARGSIVGIVLTSAARAEAWSSAVADLAPGVIRMTAVGTMAPATVSEIGIA